MLKKNPSLDHLTTHFVQYYLDAQPHLNSHLPPHLLSLREKALKSFQEQGLPHPKKEAYRYTPLLRKFNKHFAQGITPPSHSSPTPPPQHHLTSLDAYHLFLDPHLPAPIETLQKALPPQLHILPLTTAYSLYPKLVNLYFAQLAPSPKESLVALNTLLFQQAYLLYLTPNTQLHKPLIIHHTLQSPPSTTAHPRLLMVIGQKSQLQLIETFHTSSPGLLINRVAEIILQPHAHLTHYHLQPQESAQALQMHYTYVHQQEASHLSHHTFTLSGELIRNDLHVALAAPHSQADLYGMYKGSDHHHIENHITVAHQAPHAHSQQYYKGVVEGHTTGVFRGGIYVDKGAPSTEAAQQHHAWILDDSAGIKTQPLLSIEADEVQCSHGATISQPDEEQLFYLKTRGYSLEEARGLLLQGFCQEMINTVHLPLIRPYITTTLLP